MPFVMRSDRIICRSSACFAVESGMIPDSQYLLPWDPSGIRDPGDCVEFYGESIWIIDPPIEAVNMSVTFLAFAAGA